MPVATPAPDPLTGVMTDSADVEKKRQLEEEGKKMRQEENEKLISMISNVTANTPEELKALTDIITDTTSNAKDVNPQAKVREHYF